MGGGEVKGESDEVRSGPVSIRCSLPLLLLLAGAVWCPGSRWAAKHRQPGRGLTPCRRLALSHQSPASVDQERRRAECLAAAVETGGGVVCWFTQTLLARRPMPYVELLHWLKQSRDLCFSREFRLRLRLQLQASSTRRGRSHRSCYHALQDASRR